MLQDSQEFKTGYIMASHTDNTIALKPYSNINANLESELKDTIKVSAACVTIPNPNIDRIHALYLTNKASTTELRIQKEELEIQREEDKNSMTKSFDRLVEEQQTQNLTFK